MKHNSSGIGLQTKKKRQSFLIMSAFSPFSYSPAGERIFYTALASNPFFDSTTVLTLRSTSTRYWHRENGHEHGSRVQLYAVNFARAVLYPFSMLFDPVKFLVFLVHGFILSKRFRPSHILASMPPIETGMSAWLLSKYTSSKMVVDLRDDWESAMQTDLSRYFPLAVLNLVSKIARKVYSNAFIIFAATQTIADTIKRRGVATRTLLVPNGADASVFVHKDKDARRRIRVKYNLPLNKVILVYCGSGTTPYYRLDNLISSIKFIPEEIKDEIYMVFYVYDGLARLKQTMRKLGIEDSILQIRNPVPRGVLAEVLAACDVGLIPFDDDASLLCARSTKLYEYLSSGLYVISSGPEGGELAEFFSANSAFGLFIHPSAESFASSFGFVLKNKRGMLRSDLKRLRHLFVKKDYDRKRVMQAAINALLETVMVGNR